MKALTLIFTLMLISCQDITEKQQQEPVKDHTNGMILFLSYCAGCHGADGEGGAGPNLTDRYFLYGNHKDVIKTVIVNGIIDKGMPEWGFAFDEGQLVDLVDYVKSLEGLNLQGKDPEGVLIQHKK